MSLQQRSRAEEEEEQGEQQHVSTVPMASENYLAPRQTRGDVTGDEDGGARGTSRDAYPVLMRYLALIAVFLVLVLVPISFSYVARAGDTHSFALHF